MSHIVNRKKHPTIKIGLISDTHGSLNDSVKDVFNGTDLIIHAGDVGKPEILDKLGQIAPVVAVRGNMDAGQWAAHLPDYELVEIGNHRVYVLHNLDQFDIDPSGAGIDAVISGHIHKPSLINKNDVLFINPGSASQPRHHQHATVALFFIAQKSLNVKFIKLY